MKIMKNVIYIVLLAMIFAFLYAVQVQATTIEVTADTLNLRKEASTSSNILATISKGTECEFIEESGDWYKVKYKTYTGYVSKEYVKLNETIDNNDDNLSNNNNNIDNSTTEETIVTGKLSKDTKARLLPLINSSIVETLKKNTQVTIITEINNWSYVATDSVSLWIRSDYITGKKTNVNKGPETGNNNDEKDDTDSNETKTDNVTAKEKTMYVNDSYVNLRKEPSTSANILMVVALNTKLTVIGEEGDWYKVKTSDGNAYISKKLLSDNKVETTSRGNIVRGAAENISSKNLENPDKAIAVTTSNTTNNSNSSAKGNEIVAYAKKFLKVPYVYGGASPKGFDCSGFTMYVYKKFGISMRHGAQAQAKLGTAIKADKSSSSSLKQKLKPGDLVFFLDYETMDEIGHCGIYIGDGKFIHASSGSGYCVKIDSLLPGQYYNTRYCAARRVI